MRPLDVEALLSHTEFVAALARSLVRDEHLRLDLAQEAWLRALRSPPERMGAVRTWLGRVLERTAHNLARGSSHRLEREAIAARPEAVPSALEIAEQEAARKRVVDALVDLEEPYRSVILLRFYEGLPPRRIAQLLDCPVETVRTRVKRGLERLREKLREREGNAWALALMPLLRRSAAPPKIAAGIAAASLVLAGTAALGGVQLVVPRAGAPGRTAELSGAGVAAIPPARVESPGSERSRVALPEKRRDVEVRVSWRDDQAPAAGVGLELVCAADSSRRRGITDAEGVFRAPDVAAGEIFVRIDRSDPEALPGTYEIGADATSIEVELPAGFDVSGRVVDRNGNPVAGAPVWLSMHDDPADGQVVTRSDEKGAFALRGLREHQFLAARIDGLEPSPAVAVGRSANVELIAGSDERRDAERAPARIAPRALSTLRGRVVDSRSVGLAAWRIRVSAIDLGSRWDRTLTTSEDGSFVLRDRPARTLRVVAADPDSPFDLPSAIASSAPGDEAELVLRVDESARARSEIRGFVVDDAGKPILDAQAILSADTGPYFDAFGTAVDRSDGSFRLGPIPAGRYFLQLVAPGRPPRTFDAREVTAGETAELGALSLRQPGSVTAIVRRSGAAAGRAWLSVRDAAGGERSAAEIGAAEAEVPFPALAEGRYLLRIRGTHVLPAEVQFEIRSGEPTRIEAPLAACAPQAFRFSGAPVTGALRFRVWDAAGKIVLGRLLSPEERAAASTSLGLAPGRYRVEATVEPDLRGEAFFEASPAPVTVPLR